MLTPRRMSPRSNSKTLQRDSQAMISYQLFSHFEALGPVTREMYGLFDDDPCLNLNMGYGGHLAFEIGS